MMENRFSLHFLQRLCVVGAIIALPFTHTSHSLPFIGNNLFTLPLVFGFIFFAFEIFKANYPLIIIEKKYLLFLGIFFLWNTFCSVHGILTYPYFHFVGLEQMENFKNAVEHFISWGIIDDPLHMIAPWQGYKGIRSSLLSLVFSLFISFWIIHIYKYRWNTAFKDIRNALLVLSSILVCYSVVEVGYLTGSYVCKGVLLHINPLYMKIADVNNWWPPLLWPDLQLRSLFAEPSFLGIFSAFAVPILGSAFFEKITSRVLLQRLLFMALIAMLVMAKARTGLLLLLGESVLIVGWSLFYKRDALRALLILAICAIISASAGWYATSHFVSIDPMVKPGKSETTIEQYVSDNVTSVAGDKRSNKARFVNNKRTFEVGLDHPIFGVGKGLHNAYLYDKLTDEENIGEVGSWSATMVRLGPLKPSYPVLSQFSGVIAEVGVPGLLLYMVPIFAVFFYLIRYSRYLKDAVLACLVIAYIGLITAFLSNTASLQFYILTGVLFVFICSKRKDWCEVSHISYTKVLKQTVVKKWIAILCIAVVCAGVFAGGKYMFSSFSNRHGDYLIARTIVVTLPQNASSNTTESFDAAGALNGTYNYLEFIKNAEEQGVDFTKIDGAWKRKSDSERIDWLKQKLRVQGMRNGVAEVTLKLDPIVGKDVKQTADDNNKMIDIFMAQGKKTITDMKPDAQIKEVNQVTTMPVEEKQAVRPILMKYGAMGFGFGFLVGTVVFFLYSLRKAYRQMSVE